MDQEPQASARMRSRASFDADPPRSARAALESRMAAFSGRAVCAASACGVTPANSSASESLIAARAQQLFIGGDEAARGRLGAHVGGAGGESVVVFDIPRQARQHGDADRPAMMDRAAASPSHGRAHARSRCRNCRWRRRRKRRPIAGRRALRDRADSRPPRRDGAPTRRIASMRIEAGGGIGVAIGRRLDRVDQRVDPGRGGQRRGKADRQFGIEHDFVGLDLVAPQPDLGVIVARQDRRARRLRPRSRGRRHANFPQAPASAGDWRRADNARPNPAPARSPRPPCQGRAPSRRRGRRRRSTSFRARQRRGGVGLGDGRIALEGVENREAKAVPAQGRRRFLRSRPRRFQAGIGDEQRMALRPASAAMRSRAPSPR